MWKRERGRKILCVNNTWNISVHLSVRRGVRSTLSTRGTRRSGRTPSRSTSSLRSRANPTPAGKSHCTKKFRENFKEFLLTNQSNENILRTKIVINILRYSKVNLFYEFFAKFLKFSRNLESGRTPSRNTSSPRSRANPTPWHEKISWKSFVRSILRNWKFHKDDW